MSPPTLSDAALLIAFDFSIFYASKVSTKIDTASETRQRTVG